MSSITAGGKIEEAGLLPVVLRLHVEGLPPSRIAAFLKENYSLSVHRKSVYRTLIRVREAIEAGKSVPKPATDAELGKAIEKFGGKKKIEMARRIAKIREQAHIEAPLASGLSLKDIQPEHDSIRLSGVIHAMDRIAETGMLRMRIPRWALRQMFSGVRPGPDGTKIRDEPQALKLGLYVSEEDLADGHPDDLIEVARVYDRGQQMRAASEATRAITAKYRLSESNLKITALMETKTEVEKDGKRTVHERKIRASIKGRLSVMTPAVLAVLASGYVPDQQMLRKGQREQLAEVIEMATEPDDEPEEG